MASSDGLKVPGFGLPLDHLPEWHRQDGQQQGRFPHAIADFFATHGITVRERRMLDFINQITDKPRWTEKIQDESIVLKWREEACGTADEQETSPRHLSRQCFAFAMEELRDKAAYLEKYGVVHVFDVHATIVKVDLEDDDKFCNTLNNAVRHLENVPAAQNDWHPGSDETVLDLLHPSLFPLQYGRTRVLPHVTEALLLECSKHIGRGQVCPTQEEVTGRIQARRTTNWANSSSLRPWGNYQWLPSEVSFSSDGNANINSYINNLHPACNGELYVVLATAIEKALPLWNECLSWFHDRMRIRVARCGWNDYKYPDWYVFESAGYSDEELTDDDGEEHEEDDDEEYHMRNSTALLKEELNERRLVQPDPSNAFVPFEDNIGQKGLPRLDLRTRFLGRLQVVFKLATIHLTPDKPQYNGSNWHVEGALNEHICATALFYYDQDNIEDSFLEFRQDVDELEMVMKPNQGEYIAAEDIFGVRNGGSTVQQLGRVSTRPSRIIAFPNVMQHRVSPFGLADQTKPGHRKILAMFLIDPHIRILSTENVPPQRRDWWADELRHIVPFADLPVELFDRIVDAVDDFPITWQEGCHMREALMAERRREADEYNRALAEDVFSFCEH